MKVPVLIVCFLPIYLFGQGFNMDTYEPFIYGVASGDPLSDQVIIWTKAAPTDTTQPLTVNWRMATDTAFSNIINSGTFTTTDSSGFTIKVDVTGLQPDTWYYYDFETGGNRSLKGRTKTAPVGSPDQLRFAVVTCAKYSDGFFNGYARIGERNDIDAVVHVGDYIYESDSEGDIGRPMNPLRRCSTLTDFRTRYAQYRSDPDLMYAHQQYPWIVVWDDHETSNDAWLNGSEHWPDSTVYAGVKIAAAQAYYEWMPIRQPDPNESSRIYRSFQFGDLIDLMMLDTRRQGRMQQIDLADTIALNDPNRTILGQQQYDWLIDQIDSSNAQWKIFGQQVMFSPLLAFGFPVNNDQWNGYPAERQKILNHLYANNIKNTVVLTGDFHVAFAMDVPRDVSIYDTITRNGSIAVEFVTTAVAQDESGFAIPFTGIKQFNPWFQFGDIESRGYLILDISRSRVQGDYYFVESVSYPTSAEHFDVGFYTNDGDQFLNRTVTPSSSSAPEVTQAPLPIGYDPQATAITTDERLIFIGAYPNPVDHVLHVAFQLDRPDDVIVELSDLQSRTIFSEEYRSEPVGSSIKSYDIGKVSPGIYLLKMVTRSGEYCSKKIVVPK